MEKLSKTEEKRILRALESAVTFVSEGASPDEALVKTAQEYQFGPNIVRRMVEAYNVSKTLSHYKKASVDQRSATFPLADAQKVLALIYAPDRKAEVKFSAAILKVGEREDFMAPRPALAPIEQEKAAALPIDPEVVYARWTTARDYLQRTMENSRMDLTDVGVKLAAAVERAASYFELLDHEPFAEVEKRAVYEYGELGKRCMSMIHAAANLTDKRASATDEKLVFDRSREPYTQVAAIVSWAKAATIKSAALGRTREALKKHLGKCPYSRRKEAHLLDEALVDGLHFGDLPTSADCRRELKEILLGKESAAIEKRAITPSLPITDVINMLVRGPAERVRAEDVADPQHEAILKSVRVKAMLNDLMSNDEVISQYPRESVVDVYNKLVDVAPEASSKSIVMRGLLRRALQQGEVFEPHEAHKIVEIEKELPTMYTGVGAGDNK